jgi:uncharacterized protein
MQLAIISDSHGGLDRLRDAFMNLRTGGITTILHAGDFVVDNIANLLQEFPDLNFWIARGNCDIDEVEVEKIQELENVEFSQRIETEIANKKITIAHKIEDLNGVDADIYISGHTHIPRIQNNGDQLWINPGSLFDSGRYCILDTETFAIVGKVFAEKI